MLARKSAWKILAALAIVAILHARQLRAAEPAADSGAKPAAKSTETASIAPADKSLPPVPITADLSQPAAKKSRPQITEDEGIIHGEKANYPRVVFITAKDSPECDKVLARLRTAGGDFENLAPPDGRSAKRPTTISKSSIAI